MFFRGIVKLFESGNVCVTGLRGTGKDVLFGSVIGRRRADYVSNLDYTNGKGYNELDFDKINAGRNTWENLLKGDPYYYEYPYPMGSDIYLSDAGIYLPAQYCSELNKRYPYLPTYMALSRQVSHNNFHFNSQNLNRVWDKIREQSDIYIRCKRCVVLFGLFVIQYVVLYDKYDSCVARVEPCRVRVPILAMPARRQQAEMYVDNFRNQHGKVEGHWLFYINRSKHDTYYFEKLFKNGRRIPTCTK